jgi:hypothetical protein
MFSTNLPSFIGPPIERDLGDNNTSIQTLSMIKNFKALDIVLKHYFIQYKSVNKVSNYSQIAFVQQLFHFAHASIMLMTCALFKLVHYCSDLAI